MEKKWNGLAQVVPKVGAFGFIERDELRVFCFGKRYEASEFARSPFADFGSAFDADAEMPGISRKADMMSNDVFNIPGS